MKKHQKQIISLTAEKVLSSIFDLALPFFESHRIYRVKAREYRDNPETNNANFAYKIQYLKRRGLIEAYIEKKELHYEITPKGLDKIKEYDFNSITVTRSKGWDGKWRLVIYDVPEKHKKERDVFQKKLRMMDFHLIQDSVYAHPFECTKEVDMISALLNINDHVVIAVADVVRGEEEVIETFMRKGILSKQDMVVRK